MIKPNHIELNTQEVRNIVYKRAFDQNGERTQLDMVQEECAELIQVVSKVKRGLIDRDNLIEECADVMVMIEQLEMHFGIGLEVKQAMAYKVARLSEDLDRVGLCDTCAYRDDCDWPKLHPKTKLKECEDYDLRNESMSI